MINMKDFTGSVVALVTPFNGDGSINFEAMGRLIEFQIENKTDAILILGTTGESSTMTHEEDDRVCEFTLNKVAGRVPVIVGSGSNCTETMLEKSVKYSDMGADALLVISPYYNKANEEGMYRHFASVADKTSAPCILYNVPGRTSCAIAASVVKRLSSHGNIIGIKEASGDLSYASKIARYLNDDFVMFSGNDDIILPMLSLGARGVISVWANIMPLQSHELVKRWFEGDIAGARALQLENLDIINALFMEVNPIPVKEALNIMGMNAGAFRLPLYEMESGNREKLKAIMAKEGLI